MSVHWKGACYAVKDVNCNVPCHTKYNNRQPYLVMQGHATSMNIDNNIATIER